MQEDREAGSPVTGCDGRAVNIHQVRFAGIVDLEPEDTGNMGLDRVHLWLVATKSEDTGFKVLSRTGDIRRKDVAKVSEARLLTGVLRDQAIAFMAQQGAEMDLGVERTEHDADLAYHVGDMEAPYVAAETFVPADDPPAPTPAPSPVSVAENGGPRRVGSVYPRGRQDPILSRFLEEES